MVPSVPSTQNPLGTQNQNQNPYLEGVSGSVPSVPSVPSEKRGGGGNPELHDDVGSTATYGGADIPTAQKLKSHLLTITAVSGAMATVVAPELSHPVEVPYADLEIDF